MRVKLLTCKFKTASWISLFCKAKFRMYLSDTGLKLPRYSIYIDFLFLNIEQEIPDLTLDFNCVIDVKNPDLTVGVKNRYIGFQVVISDSLVRVSKLIQILLKNLKNKKMNCTRQRYQYGLYLKLKLYKKRVSYNGYYVTLPR